MFPPLFIAMFAVFIIILLAILWGAIYVVKQHYKQVPQGPIIFDGPPLFPEEDEEEEYDLEDHYNIREKKTVENTPHIAAILPPPHTNGHHKVPLDRKYWGI